MTSEKFTQISVHRQLHQALKLLAATRNITVAELIRQMYEKETQYPRKD